MGILLIEELKKRVLLIKCVVYTFLDVMEKVNREMKDSENLRLRNIRDKSLKKTEYGMR